MHFGAYTLLKKVTGRVHCSAFQYGVHAFAGGFSAVALFGCLAVLETHIL